MAPFGGGCVSEDIWATIGRERLLTGLAVDSICPQSDHSQVKLIFECFVEECKHKEIEGNALPDLRHQGGARQLPGSGVEQVATTIRRAVMVVLNSDPNTLSY